LLHELEENGDREKQALYRECQEAGTGFYPLKVALPSLGSPSLLDRVQNRMDVEGILRSLRRQRLKERGNTVYIPPQAKPSLQASDTMRFPLMETVKGFVDSDQQVFLLLGDSGAGKSTFNRELEYELWRMYKKKTGVIPLYINLPSIDKPEHDMIAKQLRKAEFTEPQIRELKLYRKFIVICDGYDESQQTHNLYTSNRLNQAGDWHAKMVISCRSEYLGADYRDRFQPGDRNQLSSQALLQEAVMTPFSLDQVQGYIHQYVLVHQPLWGVKEYMDVLDHIPSLKELVKNPFLMSLSLEVLPRMVDPGQDLRTTRITRVALYDQFVEHWLDRGKKRLGEKNLSPQARAAFESLSDEGFTQSGMDFLKKLCVAIYKEQGGQPIVRYSRYKDEDSWKAVFFSREDEKQLLREACPLTRTSNQHRFIHRSLLDYGLALAVFDPHDLKEVNVPESRLARRGSTSSEASFVIRDTMEDTTVSGRLQPDINSPLAWRSFVKQPSVLQFLEERVQQVPAFKKLLFDYIEYSKTDKKWRTAAANAITILVRAGVQFNQADLQRIQVPGADLSYGVFESAQLQKADLRNVNLRCAWLPQADLSNAQMSGVQFGELPFLSHKSEVRSSLFSPDGDTFAIGLKNGQIAMYSTSNWELLWTSSGHSLDICCISYSVRGDLLASGGKEGEVRMWDVRTGECRFTLTDHDRTINYIAFSPQGDQFASASSDKTLRLWSVLTGERRRVLKKHTWAILHVTYSPDGSQIATCSVDKTVRLWNNDSGVCNHTLHGHRNFVRTVVYSPQGDQVASASLDKTVRLWDTTTGACLHILTGHTDHVFFAIYSPHGDQVASVGKDKTVRLWDVESGTCRRTLTGHADQVNSVMYSPRGDLVASASNDGTVRLWDVEAGSCRQTFSGHKMAKGAIFSPAGDQVATRGDDTIVRLWDVEVGTARHLSSGHSDRVNCVEYSPTGNQAASCSKDGTIRLWDVETGICRSTLTGHTGEINYIAYSPQGDLIASASNDNTVRVWDAQTGECRHTLTAHIRFVLHVAYSPSGNQIASCSTDKTARLWDTFTGICSHALDGHGDFVRSVVYSPRGDQVASASDDKTVRLWDTATGACLYIFIGPKEGITSVAYSLQGDQIAITNKDLTIRLRDVKTGECRHTLSKIDKVVYSPQGGIVASGNGNGTVRLWNIESGECLHSLTGHTDSRVLLIKLSPQGDRVASTSMDNTMRLWHVASGQCQAVIRGSRGIRSIVWSTNSDASYVVVGFVDGSVAMWQVMDDGDPYHARMRWRTTKGGLAVKDTLIQDVRGLSQLTKKLLEQRGAVGKPIEDIRGSSRKVATMTSVVSKFKSPTIRMVEGSSVAKSSEDHIEQVKDAQPLRTRRYTM